MLKVLVIKKKKKKLLDIQEGQGAIGYPIIGCDILIRLVYVPVHRKPGQPANIKKTPNSYCKNVSEANILRAIQIKN